MAGSKKIVLDTCILIEILRGNKEIINEIYEFNQEDIFITPVVIAELYRGARNKKDLKKCKRLVDKFGILPLNEGVTDVFTSIFENFALSHRPAVPDILIAAVTLYFEFSLYTLNTKDFRFIPGLELLSIQ